MEIQQNIVLTGSFGAPTKPSKIQIINLRLANNLSPVMASAVAVHTHYFLPVRRQSKARCPSQHLI